MPFPISPKRLTVNIIKGQVYFHTILITKRSPFFRWENRLGLVNEETPPTHTHGGWALELRLLFTEWTLCTQAFQWLEQIQHNNGAKCKWTSKSAHSRSQALNSEQGPPKCRLVWQQGHIPMRFTLAALPLSCNVPQPFLLYSPVLSSGLLWF